MSSPAPPEDEHCRLCAEPTPPSHLIECESDEAREVNVVAKCAEINIDMSPSNHLPKAICFSCFDQLRRAFIFIYEARSAQKKLAELYPVKIRNDSTEQLKVESIVEVKAELAKDLKIEVSDDDMKVKDEPMSDVDMICRDPSTDSDVPLLRPTQEKKKKVKKKKKKIIDESDVKEEIFPLLLADALPLEYPHSDISWLDYEWRCGECEALYRDVVSLRRHSQEIHSTCCVFKCCQCGKKITEYKSLLRHARLHYRSLGRHCDICNEKFKTGGEVRRHRAGHGGEACGRCGALFAARDDWEAHAQSYGKKRRPVKKEEDFECEECNKKFKSRSNLLSHRAVHSERRRNFSCHVCGKMFYTNGTLSAHMAIHDDSKPYKCDYCPLAFRARGNLISHSSLHSGVKPYVCEQCGKSFRVKRHLKSHLIVHTDLMPFSCEFCGKPFRFKTRLNLHLRQHTGAKPYKCVHCQRDFTNGSNYKKHMKRRHNVDVGKKNEEPPREQKCEENEERFIKIIV